MALPRRFYLSRNLIDKNKHANQIPGGDTFAIDGKACKMGLKQK